MIYYNLYKCRNYNFLQLIKSYNELISKQPSNMPISILQRYRMTENLLGDDSVDLLGNALFYDGEKIETRSLGLFEGVKGKYYLAQNAKFFLRLVKKKRHLSIICLTTKILTCF